MVDETKNPGSDNPFHKLSLSELEKALQHAEELRQSYIRHPELHRPARPTVEHLVRQAASIKFFLDGDTWDDTKDLI